MSKVTEYHLRDRVYRTALTVILAKEPTEMDKYLDDIGFTGERLKHSNHNAAYYRIKPDENEAGNDGSLLWMRERNIPGLVHELSHFIFQEFTEKDVPLRLENDEAFCYYIEFWVNEVLEAWKPAVEAKVKPKK